MGGEVRRDEVRVRDRVVVDQQHERAARDGRALLRAAARGLRSRAARRARGGRPPALEPGSAAVGRAVVDDHDLVAPARALALEGGEAALQGREALVGADDDRELGGRSSSGQRGRAPQHERSARETSRRGSTARGRARRSRPGRAAANASATARHPGSCGRRPPTKALEPREPLGRQELVVVHEQPLAALAALLEHALVHRPPHLERASRSRSTPRRYSASAHSRSDALGGGGRLAEDAQEARIAEHRAPGGQRVQKRGSLKANGHGPRGGACAPRGGRGHRARAARARTVEPALHAARAAGRGCAAPTPSGTRSPR